ncbi:MAG TPA: DUF1540 domain-containing protein [Clostridiales bacterium]|nr:DUF1540 domain-containing protein [Clostridiales bacterium]
MQGQRVQKTNEHLPGVKCVVSSCYYHKPGDYCSAEKIEIQPPYARDTDETDCATFIKA